jgi:hypothetical protein
MMEAVRTSKTSVDNHFTRQYIPEDNSEHQVHQKLPDEFSLPVDYMLHTAVGDVAAPARRAVAISL